MAGIYSINYVKTMLHTYKENLPEEERSREVLQCYCELSPESQDDIAEILLQFLQLPRKGFGILSALELLGALIKAAAEMEESFFDRRMKRMYQDRQAPVIQGEARDRSGSVWLWLLAGAVLFALLVWLI